MERLFVFAFVGLLAQVIDGSLGMAYGVTASTSLLANGVAPAVASASVHLAEVGTTAVSGFSHWRFGNVEWAVVLRIAVPGAIGAFIGATVLSNLSTESATPWVAVLLLLLGAYIVARFVFGQPPWWPRPPSCRHCSRRWGCSPGSSTRPAVAAGARSHPDADLERHARPAQGDRSTPPRSSRSRSRRASAS